MSNQQLVEEIWAQYDKNGNGKLDKDEATKFLDDICGSDPKMNDQRAQLEALIDSNGDDVLDKSEMLAALSFDA